MSAALALATAAAVTMGPAAKADEVRDKQWHLRFLHAKQAARLSQGAGVTVAVVDSGVDARHPDLTGQVLPGTDFMGDSGDGRVDTDGHGTCMASLIAGHGHGPGHRDGAMGLAPKAKILPVRADTSPEQVAPAIRWAVGHGAQVINLSLGWDGADPAVRSAIHYALAHDVVVVASAGNVFDGSDQVAYPAANPGVIAVSAVGKAGRFVAKVSVHGKQVVLAAPGYGVVSATKDDGYFNADGTSDAAALVSATAALVRARYPELNAASVINRLIRTADDKGPHGRDPKYGFGVVDPVEALTMKTTPIQVNPLRASSPAASLAKR